MESLSAVSIAWDAMSWILIVCCLAVHLYNNAFLQTYATASLVCCPGDEVQSPHICTLVLFSGLLAQHKGASAGGVAAAAVLLALTEHLGLTKYEAVHGVGRPLCGACVTYDFLGILTPFRTCTKHMHPSPSQ